MGWQNDGGACRSRSSMDGVLAFQWVDDVIDINGIGLTLEPHKLTAVTLSSLVQARRVGH